MQFPLQQQIERINTIPLKSRTEATLEAVRYYFGHDWRAMRDKMQPDRVAEFYRYLSDLWPARLNVADALRGIRGVAGLNGFYAGMIEPETIVPSLARISLYTDRVYIPQPFHMPWKYVDDYDPVQHPEVVRQDTLKWSVALMLIEPWIRSGLFIMIPDPADFSQPLRDAFTEAAKQRLPSIEQSSADDVPHLENIWKHDYFRSILSLPDEIVVHKLREVGMTDKDEAEMVRYIHELRRNDPFFLAGVLEGDGALHRHSVPTLEEIIYICGQTGLYPFTDMRGKWREILDNSDQLSEEAQTWSPLTKAFSALQFSFLDGFDASFAHSIRDDGRLIGFRVFLRKIWKAIDGAPSHNKAEQCAREFADELTYEFGIAEQEWKAIRRKYDLSVHTAAAAAATAGVAAGVSLGLVQGALGVAMPLVMYLYKAAADGKQLKGDLQQFRLKVPMSLFVDLQTRSS